MVAKMSIELRVACEADAEHIASLVNRAYRPSPYAVGWTSEVNIIAGERTTPEQVLALLRDQSILLLLYRRENILACAHVQRDQLCTYIGMLAVDPKMQGQGLGKEMLFHAEAYAVEKFNASLLKISVLSVRPELLSFYQRRGYALTGEVEEYPLLAGVGQPIVEGVQVLFLVKRLSNSLIHKTLNNTEVVT